MSKRGERIKQEASKRGVELKRYDPQTETYKTWYGVPMSVIYRKRNPKESEKDDMGYFKYGKRKITVLLPQSEMPQTLYHEALHAEFAPIAAGLKIGISGIPVCLLLQGAITNNSLPPFYSLAFGAVTIGAGLLEDILEEYIVSKIEDWKFRK